jgi:hypothetical protein
MRGVRFFVIFVTCLILVGLVARVMDDSDARWTTGAAVWGGAFALATVDLVAGRRR